MVLKGVNWVHNTNIGVTFLGKWSFISLRNLWISVFDVVLLKVELEMWFLQFLRLNLPENCSFHQNPWFSSKSAVFSKICSFHKNLWFSSKSVVFIKIHVWFSPKSVIFIKIHNFCHFSLSFQEDNIKCETKDHLPRKVIPTFLAHLAHLALGS